MGFWSQILGIEETETVEASLDEPEEDLSDAATYFEPPGGWVYDWNSGSWVEDPDYYDDTDEGF